ncbi:MAG: Uma2 family endonuclease [Acidobacteriota bacterium]|jgi:Uma2 family endonuclease
MTQIAIRSESVPIELQVGAELRLTDDTLFRLCSENPELRIERTAQGDLIVMTPAGGESSHRNLRIATALALWADEDGTGVAFDSSAGFILANGAMRSPDASWVETARLAKLKPEEKRRFIPLCPDFVLELKSPTDRSADLQAKMEEYRDNGARLGWLIDPETRRVAIYRPRAAVEVLDQPSEIHGDPELPRFTLELHRVWQPL